MKRPLLWASVGMCAGVALCSFRQASLAIASAVVFLSVYLIKRSRILAIGLFAGVFLGVFSGFCYRYTSGNLRKSLNHSGTFTGVVSSVSGYGFQMRLTRYGNERESRSCGNIYPYYVYVRTDAIPEEKATVIVTGYAEDFKPPENPGQFDAKEYYPSVGCIAAVRADSVQIKRKPNLVRRFLTRIRNRVSGQLYRLFPKETVGLPTALLLGDRGAFEEEPKKLYEQFGLAHILAVSGLHIGILSEILLAFLLFLFPRKPSEILTFLLLLFYGALCGFPISCIRAVFTFFLAAFCGHFARTFDRISANSFLLILVLFFAPYRLTNVSFQLSFAAGFLTSVEPFRPGEKRSLRKMLRTSVLLQAGLLPITLRAYYSVTPVGIFLNVFVLAAISGAFVLLILAVTFSGVSLTLGLVAAGPVHYGELLLIRVMKLLHSLRFLTITTGKPSLFRIVLFLIFFATILIFERRFDERLRYILFASFLVFLPIHNGTMIASLSVGQGECTVILSKRTVIVCDCGSNSKEEVGENILKPFLHYYGYNRVDYLFLSHTDEDHINGIRNCDLFKSVKNIYTGAAFSNVREFLEPSVGRKTSVIATKGGDSLTIGPVSFRFLTANRGMTTDSNELCQITEFTLYGYRFLLPGDVSSEILQAIPREELHTAYYLKGPHHGSRYSAEESFYETVRPEVSVISVGYNSYGHPSEEAKSLAGTYSQSLYITKQDGAILTVFQSGRPTTYSYTR